MLTRLYVSGFKNLVDTEIHFGPLTCIAGLNGVGKSNVFDAIAFLSRLADKPFIESVAETRGGEDLLELFTAGGDGRMVLEGDVLIPRRGRDDFNQVAEAGHTFLTYRLELRLVRDEIDLPRVRLEHESLLRIPRGEAKERLGFHHAAEWRESVVFSSGGCASFIETVAHGDDAVVRLSSDEMGEEAEKSKPGGGKGTNFLARDLPRTVLSSAQNAGETRTAVLMRAEMRSWRILQLEPSALRRPDDLQAPSVMANDGEHLPATLYRMASQGDASRTYTELANRLAELVDGVRTIRVDRDGARRVLRLVMKNRSGVELPASSLSDGTLRFVALSVLEQDPAATGLLCLEEPENGIHPERIDALMELLTDMAVDVSEPADDDNPLRQVIVATHSPLVAARARMEDLVFAGQRDAGHSAFGRPPLRSLVLRPLSGTWRCGQEVWPVAPGNLLSYLDSVRPTEKDVEIPNASPPEPRGSTYKARDLHNSAHPSSEQ